MEVSKRLSASDTGNKQLKAKASSMQLKYSRARLAGGPTLIGRSLEGRTACPLSNANCEHDDHQAGESGSRGRVAVPKAASQIQSHYTGHELRPADSHLPVTITTTSQQVSPLVVGKTSLQVAYI